MDALGDQNSILLAGASFQETCDMACALGGADMVLTSPPYDDARSYGNDVSWSFKDYQALGDSILLALKPGGHCLMVLDSPVREWRKGFGTERGFTPWRVMLDWAERVGFRVPDRLAYGRMGAPGRYEGRFRNDWEPLLWFQKPGERGFFDKDVISKPGVSGAYAGRSASNRGSDQEETQSRRLTSGTAAEQGLKRPGTYWDQGCITGIIQASKVDHPAQFALPFAEDAVRCFCPPNGLVVDPFLGSGTSAVAAKKQGRRFLGGDLFGNEAGLSWAEITMERLKRQ